MSESFPRRIRLQLRPSPPSPLRADAGRDELVHLWDGLDLEGRRLVLSNARAVAEVTGRAPRVVPGPHAP